MKQLEKYVIVCISFKRLTIKEIVDFKKHVVEAMKYSEYLLFDFKNVEYIDNCIVSLFINLTKKTKIRIVNANQDIIDIFRFCQADLVIQLQLSQVH